MSWSVRADVNIDWKYGILEQELKDFMVKEKMDVCELHGYHDENDEVGCNGVDFSMWGNKGVNYDCLEAIKNFMKENGVKEFEISANEYVEADGGYYYDSTDEVDEE